MLNDPIADLLTRIRNALKQRYAFVDIPLSKMKVNIAKVLEDQGYVKNTVVNEEKRLMRVYLKYEKNRTPVIHGLKRISKPGLRKYVRMDQIPRVLGGMGNVVLSTNRGIVDGKAAREQKLGGELLLCIW